MAKTVAELQAEKEKIEAELAEAMAIERTEALADVKEKIKTYGFTLWDVRGVLAESKYQQKREEALALVEGKDKAKK
jgi:hypothetical protein